MNNYRSLFSAVLLSQLLLFPLVSPQQGLCSSLAAAPPSQSKTPSALGRVIAVRIYGVKDGGTFKKTFMGSDLVSLRQLRVDGYVSGVVAFCTAEMSIRIDGRSLPPLRRNGDGSFSTGSPGWPSRHIQPVEGRDNTYFQKSGPGNTVRRKLPAVQNAYSVFPKVTGSAVRPEQRFNLEFEDKNSRVRLGVEQVGYRSVQLLYADSRVPFRYQGTRLASLEAEIPDAEQRMAAIARGIESVEDRLGFELVSEAVILDYGAIENAITREDSDKIWFYIETFRGEPVAELETIAAHETLHKYVDRRRLAHSGHIREWFSDLKHFGPLSYERMLMVTQGVSLSKEDEEAPAGGDDTFFRFISEKHFLEDRKGGHPGDNLDEFCTSFIHSLLYVQRLGLNLDKPLRLPDGTSRLLTLEQKRQLLDDYIETIVIFRKAVSLQENGPDTSADGQDLALLLNGFSQASQLRADGIATTVAVDHSH